MAKKPSPGEPEEEMQEGLSGGERPPGERELIVIAKPEVGMRVTMEGVASFEGEDVSPFTNFLASEGVSLIRLFGISEGRLKAEASSLAETEGVEVPDLSLYYKVQAPDERLDELASRLREQTSIDTAYVKPPAEAPIMMEEVTALSEEPPVNTPDFTSRQGYLNPAPVGIDARYAWTVSGGRGTGVRIIDIEGAWRFTHEDLRQNQGGLAAGTMSNNIGWRNHGTAVIGEFGGDRNTIGVTGICPDANVRAISIFGGIGSAGAIRRAADLLRAGDIILIELHRAGPRFNFQPRADQRGYIAMEWWPDDFDAIRYASSRGVIVVEAAGNGAENLDDAIYNTRPAGFPSTWTNPFNRSNRDSGAIVVGAGAPPPGTHGRNHGPDRSRLGFSNYGALIDAQGWGREVTTTGYGDLQGGSNEDEWYTDRFSGTSSASPIVVGAIGCKQGTLRARGVTPWTPAQTRQSLRATGSPQQDAPGRPRTQRIGNRPNLRRLITAGATCQKYLTQAKLYSTKYQKTKNRRYLCLYYRYLSLYYRCRFQQTKNRKYLCQYYRYLAAYNQCLYGVTKNRKYLCQYYRYLAAYNQCLYGVTKNRKYLCQYYRYLAAYNQCLYGVTKNRKYLCQYYRYLAAYNQCLYGVTKNRKYLCQYYRYLAQYHCCMYRATKKRAYLCRCYYYNALYYRCLYGITKNKRYWTLYQRYMTAYKKCKP